ncbi:hypothetical protein D3874_14285 [Oleomonas cavernae]|uniref:VCBS repeat-containing protein n=1 Tax=Oleomonas cavernae TaxID=2320859 RepID=A0A418WDH0_9PROT|nr:integrin alpha [Oleomonas cavernae]RJF88040.1 hypothetical protein D3874_14285 [Oleomonas cavernae]
MPDFPAQFDVVVLDGSNGFRLIGGGTYDHGGSGYSVAGLGDINGDGFDDVAIVAPFAEGWSQYTIGTVNVFEGRASPAADIYLWDGGPSFMGRYEENFGQRVAGLGDINGDGFADFMIEGSGSYYQIDVTDPYSYVWVDVPHTYVIYGGGDHLTGGTTSDYSGFAAAGDVNGDGFADVTVGTSTIVFGSATGIPDDVAPATIDAATGLKVTGATFRSIDAAGDVDGDGFGDVVARDDNNDAYVVFGRALGGSVDVGQLNGADGFKLDLPVGDLRAVVSLGDVNGDGLDDVALDAMIQGPQAVPIIYVVFGRADGVASVDPSALDGTNGFSVLGGNTLVAAAGDLNGDTLADLIVSGRYVIFGRSDAIPASVNVGALNGSNGFEVIAAGLHNLQGAGDVNGDGIGDLAAGTPGTPTLSIRAGRRGLRTSSSARSDRRRIGQARPAMISTSAAVWMTSSTAPAARITCAAWAATTC